MYTDETYVHTSHTVSKSWQSDNASKNVPFSKGQRYIVVHVGTCVGFVLCTKLIFKAKSNLATITKK